MKLTIPYQQLRLIGYEGAGNRTPVLDLNCVDNISNCFPEKVRTFLEKDMEFRHWLQKEGRRYGADSVMIYYKSSDEIYDFVTFIGEPNASINSPFSTMCGNGIRCLALHIYLSESDRERKESYVKNGIKIWASALRNLHFVSLNESQKTATVEVELGAFQHGQLAKRYTNGFLPPAKSYLSINLPPVYVPSFLERYQFGIGLNGSEDGEPHLVVLTRWEEYLEILREIKYSRSINSHSDIMMSLRHLVCLIGSKLTFETDLFPYNINVNLGLILYDEILLSTHERNLSPNQNDCLVQQQQLGICQCNTLACGTGGAAAASIAKLRGFINTPCIKTIHPGGELLYKVSDSETLMIGPARKVPRKRLS